MQSSQELREKFGTLTGKLIRYNKQHLALEVAEMKILDAGKVLERGVNMGLS